MAVQACIWAISSLRAALTRRWRLRDVRPANWGETMVAWKAWPQPPGGCVRPSTEKSGTWALEWDTGPESKSGCEGVWWGT